MIIIALVTIASVWAGARWGASRLDEGGVSVPALAGGLAVLAMLARAREHGIVFDREGDLPAGMPTAEHYLGWLLGLMALSAVVGFVIAMLVFFALFLVAKARARLGRAILLTLSAFAFLAVMSRLFVLDFPRGYLQDATDMPWPFT